MTIKKIMGISLGMFICLFLSFCNTEKSQKTSSETQVQSNSFGKDIDIVEFEKLMSKEGITLVDVRTPEEIAAGHIEGAIRIDYKADNFKEEIGKLDRDGEYLLYCRSGNRSGKTMKLMKGMGFQKMYNLEGGYLAWSEAHND